jgi:spermidine/putrescine transport system permease protein
MPGIISGALLAFIISLDDFLISFFLAGPGATTLPVYIYGAIRNAMTPGINAVSTLLLVLSVSVLTISYLIGRSRRNS